jgi:hypothetical protein
MILRLVDGPEYLERQARMRDALARLDQDAMQAVIDEVEPIPFVVGRRYRLRVLGGAPDAVRVAHVRDEAGVEYHLEHPQATKPEFLEFEALFAERVYGIPGRRSPGSALLTLADGRSALLADIDVLECEELG